jgi:hypothetical protein
VCFVVLHSSQDHLRIGTHDLATLYLVDAKTPTIGAPGRGICSVLSSSRFDGSIISVRPRYRR